MCYNYLDYPYSEDGAKTDEEKEFSCLQIPVQDELDMD